jgi:hypothetical protein
LYDQYRSVRDPSLMIFVDTDAVPPFRFKAGGWELLQTAIDVGPATAARIAQQGFFMFQVADDGVKCTELTDIPPSSPTDPYKF